MQVGKIAGHVGRNRSLQDFQTIGNVVPKADNRKARCGFASRRLDTAVVASRGNPAAWVAAPLFRRAWRLGRSTVLQRASALSRRGSAVLWSPGSRPGLLRNETQIDRGDRELLRPGDSSSSGAGSLFLGRILYGWHYCIRDGTATPGNRRASRVLGSV